MGGKIQQKEIDRERDRERNEEHMRERERGGAVSVRVLGEIKDEAEKRSIERERRIKKE